MTSSGPKLAVAAVTNESVSNARMLKTTRP